MASASSASMSAFSSVSTFCTTESRIAYTSCVCEGGSGMSCCPNTPSVKDVICSRGTLMYGAIASWTFCQAASSKIGSVGVPMGWSVSASTFASASAASGS